MHKIASVFLTIVSIHFNLMAQDTDELLKDVDLGVAFKDSQGNIVFEGNFPIDSEARNVFFYGATFYLHNNHLFELYAHTGSGKYASGRIIEGSIEITDHPSCLLKVEKEGVGELISPQQVTQKVRFNALKKAARLELLNRIREGGIPMTLLPVRHKIDHLFEVLGGGPIKYVYIDTVYQHVAGDRSIRMYFVENGRTRPINNVLRYRSGDYEAGDPGMDDDIPAEVVVSLNKHTKQWSLFLRTDDVLQLTERKLKEVDFTNFNLASLGIEGIPDPAFDPTTPCDLLAAQ